MHIYSCSFSATRTFTLTEMKIKQYENMLMPTVNYFQVIDCDCEHDATNRNESCRKDPPPKKNNNEPLKTTIALALMSSLGVHGAIEC